MFLFRLKLLIRSYGSVVALLLLTVLIGGAVLVAPAGREVLGAANTRIEGVDNTYLLAVNLDKFQPAFKIEKIEADEKYYFVLHTFNDLVIDNGVWREMVIEKTRKISKKSLETDLGLYLAEQLSQENDSRLKELRDLQAQARQNGLEKRVVVTEYSGLIGKALSVAGEFTGYEPVKKIELPSPIVKLETPGSAGEDQGAQNENQPSAENLKSVYDAYLTAHPEIDLPGLEIKGQEVATSSIIIIPAEDPSLPVEASSSIVNF